MLCDIYLRILYLNTISFDIINFPLDNVEFQEACDPLTNKPVAISLVRVLNMVMKKSGEVVSDKAVTGMVVTEPKLSLPFAVRSFQHVL